MRNQNMSEPNVIEIAVIAIGILVAMSSGCQSEGQIEQTNAKSFTTFAAPVIPEIPCDEQGLFGGGDGSLADPYVVCTGTQFSSIRDYDASHFIIVRDFGVSGVAMIPVFNGSIDGMDHTLSGVDVVGDPLVNVGDAALISHIMGSVKNLRLAGVNVSGVADVGALAAVIETTGVIENVHVVSGSVYGEMAIGGIAGWNRGSITGSSNQATITGKTSGGTASRAGGIAGKNDGLIQSSDSIVPAQGWVKGRMTGENVTDVLDCLTSGQNIGMSGINATTNCI